MREALYFETETGGNVHCQLCPRQCRIRPEQSGACRVRRNAGGRLYSDNYGLCSACALDPVEKKPLYHYFPGRKVLSLGTFGCNMGCRFCQNWTLSQQQPATTPLSPQDAVDLALRYADSGNIGLAYTYSEPVVWYEYVWDTARLAHEAGLKNIVVTNGLIEVEPLARWLEVIDALNIDVKGFNEDFYRKTCGAELAPVLAAVELAASRCHVEITTLIIPGFNDDLEEIGALAAWLASISPDIPLHLTSYHPDYKFSAPPTPLNRLQAARAAARAHLNYVYIGNVPGEDHSTYCPQCSGLLIERRPTLKEGEVPQTCPHCAAALRLCGPYR